MGEGEFYPGESAKVFWNMDDYPIPVGIDDLGSIRINIVEALHQFGFYGHVDINGHCKLLECDVIEELSKAGICYVPSCTKTYLNCADVNKVVTLDMTALLVQSAITTIAVDFAVIAKPKRELVRVLNCLASRGLHVLLINPPDEEECVFSVESLLGSAHLILASKEEEEECKEDPSDAEEDPYKILDFHEPIRPVIGASTPVFWDAEDCPIPLGSTPDEIYHSIASALVERGFSDKITIWAYLDDNKKGSWRDDLLGDKTWASRIYFLPAGDKDSRRIRMANDIIFWVRETPYKPFQDNLILVSDQFKGDGYYIQVFHHLASAALDILFVTPTQDINKPESPEWPGLLIDEGYCFADKPSQISDESSAGLLIDEGYLWKECEEETTDKLSAMDY